MAALLSTWRGRFIVAFLAIQLLLPLRYYIAHRDPHDERFAWRMFSPMRTAQCQPSITLDGAPVNLGTTFHEAWVEIAKRGRFAVLEKMGAQLCEKNPGKKVVVTLSCSYLDRPAATYGGHDVCQAPEL